MSKRYGIYDSRTNELIEGGFFSRAAADDLCAVYNQQGGYKRVYVVRVQSSIYGERVGSYT